MADFNDHSNEEFEEVPMNSSGVSRNKIGSKDFGPCLFFLLDLMHGITSQCLLVHYSYDSDEMDMPNEYILEGILHRLCEELKTRLGVNSIICDSHGQKCTDFLLIVGGGDIIQADSIKQSISLLNMPSNPDLIKIFRSPDVHYLYHQLLSRTIVLKSVTRMINDEDEEKLG